MYRSGLAAYLLPATAVAERIAAVRRRVRGARQRSCSVANPLRIRVPSTPVGAAAAAVKVGRSPLHRRLAKEDRSRHNVCSDGSGWTNVFVDVDVLWAC